MEAGGIFTSGYANFYPLNFTESSSAQLNRTNRFFVYASGHYVLSDKLVFTGTAYKSVNPNRSLQMNPYFLDYYRGNIGLDYKLTDYVKISTTIGFSNNNRLYNQKGSGLFSPNQPFGIGW